MRLGYELDLQQTQKLIMTPELRQAIAVLQMSAVELNEFVEQQLQENPVLETNDFENDETVSSTETGELNPGERFDVDWQEYFHDSSDLGFPKGQSEHDATEYSFESFTSKAPTLVEHLTFQLSLVDCRREIKRIVNYLIGNLDQNGYLKISTEEAAKELNVSLTKVEEALKVLQGMEPFGVGARSLEECLLLQVEHRGLQNPLLKPIINNHLSDLAKGRLEKIASKLGVSVAQAQQAADELRSLDPKPGRNFSSDDGTRYIVPDVVVEKVEGEYIILVNDISTPRLRVNNTYRSVIMHGNQLDNDTRKYVESKLNAAVWLIRSIEQRRLTLYKVASALVELQRDFLDRGVKYLKPLNLKDVAEQVGLHESTVSRATSNKYIQTPQGVFEMKYFFSTGLKAKGGQQVSAESIKKLLKEIISNEDPKKPLSDQKITDLLKQKGVQISRRTVAKYRDEMAIPTAGQRKRY